MTKTTTKNPNAITWCELSDKQKKQEIAKFNNGNSTTLGRISGEGKVSILRK